MTQILEMAQLADNDGVPEVQIRSGGIGAELDIEGLVAGKFFTQIFLADEIDCSAADKLDLVINGHRYSPCKKFWNPFCLKLFPGPGGRDSSLFS